MDLISLFSGLPIFTILFCLFLVRLLMVRGLKKEIRQLKNRVSALEKSQSPSPELDDSKAKDFSKESRKVSRRVFREEDSQKNEKFESVISPTTLNQIRKTDQKSAENIVAENGKIAIARKVKAKTKIENKQTESIWTKIDRQIAGNWTGVLGVLGILVGIVFLGIYSALKVGPLGRTMIVLSAAAILWLAYIYLKRKDFWEALSLWMRASSGVTFLIACVGSSSFEALKWVSNQWLGLVIFCIGVFANLWMGQSSKGQKYASFHTIMVFVFLALAPINAVTFILAAVVGVLNLLVNYRNSRWDFHTILVTVSYFLLNLFWYFQTQWGGGEVQAPVSHYAAIFCHLSFGLTGLMIHYRRAYANIPKITLPLISHLLLWTSLGINLYSHSQGSKLTTLFLGFAAAATYYFSQLAKKQGINWVFTVDRSISLLISIICLATLSRWGIDQSSSFFIALPVITIFIKMNLRYGDKIVLGLGSFLFAGVCFLGFALHTSSLNSFEGIVYSNFWTRSFFLIFSATATGYFLFGLEKNFPSLSKSDSLKKICSLVTSLSICVVPLMIFQMISIKNGFSLYILLPFVYYFILVVIRPLYRSIYFDFSFLITVVLISIYSLAVSSVKGHPSDLGLYLSLANIVAALLIYKFSHSTYLKQRILWLPISLLAIFLISLGYYVARDGFPLGVGVIWLSISTAFLLLKDQFKTENFISINREHENMPLFLLLSGLAILILFFARHFLVDIQNHIFWGSLKATQLIGILAVFVSFYYFIESKKHPQIHYQFSKFAFESVLECTFLISVALSLVHFNAHDFGLIAIALACIALFLSKKYFRLRIFSYLFWVFSLLHLAFVATTSEMPSAFLQNNLWNKNFIVILLQVIFFVLFYRQKHQLNNDIEFEGISKFYRKLRNPLRSHSARQFVFPLFFGIAVFLYWSFEKTWLSIAWTFLCLNLLILSLFFRESLFRTVAMIGVSVVVVRLLFFDLKDQDFFVKSIVFITVGVLLVAMNTIYRRFRDRYETKVETLER